MRKTNRAKNNKKIDLDQTTPDARRLFEPGPSRAERMAQGEALRATCPRNAHGPWRKSAKRPDPLKLLEQSNKGRLPELIPLRHARMLASPFAFFRGTALNMAVDLAKTPASGIRVQACGDAHLGNFRCFATPERRVIFDIHDLDETLPAPWEWDLKRLAASFVLASRTAGLSERKAIDAAVSSARTYRENMAEFAQMRTIEVWYTRFDADSLFEQVKCDEVRARKEKRLAKVRSICVVEDDFPKLADLAGGKPMLRENPPTVYHQLERDSEEFYKIIGHAFERYRTTLSDDRRVLLDRYYVADLAIRVVGVGSVGTYCCLALLMAEDKDPLFLQVKEARASVLETYAGKSVYANQGQRVVQGHRLMQSASDIFLGWTKGPVGRHFYVRQLRDMKIKFEVERFNAAEMAQFSLWCGKTLARAHARSGDPALISGYLGKSDKFEQAIGAFAASYADQCEQDFEVIKKAAAAGKLEVADQTGTS